ncbi:MAG: SET domain-containing protein [Chitinophagales bacterium]|nr:SET domain-containing protein [Chitinophagales bacterium]
MELYIQHIEGKGRGVFCSEDIDVGTLIEICPVIVLPEKDRILIDQSDLYNYYFLWGDEHKETAIALGFGSVYNHSYQPNARYETYYEEQVIHFIAHKFIPADTEITINYNHDPDDKDELWFNVQK